MFLQHYDQNMSYFHLNAKLFFGYQWQKNVLLQMFLQHYDQNISYFHLNAKLFFVYQW